MSSYEPFALESIASASPDDVTVLQTQRTLQNVYENLPVHRKKFDAAGVTPADFRRLVDLGKFPFATKQNLRANDPFGMVAVGSDRIERFMPLAVPRASPPLPAIRAAISTWRLT